MYGLDPMDDTAREEHAYVEAVLQSYPSSHVPAGFQDGVMARLKGLPKYSNQSLKFPFPWFELLGSFVMLIILLVAWIVWKILPPVYMARLNLQRLILWQQLGMAGHAEMLTWLIPLGLLIAVVCLGMSATLFSFQRNQR